MSERASLKTEIEEQTPKKAATALAKSTCLRRECRCKFSCGVRLNPTLLDGESLNDGLPGKGIR
jgi:hypothetical protein